jgi:hypothetical protein
MKLAKNAFIVVRRSRLFVENIIAERVDAYLIAGAQQLSLVKSLVCQVHCEFVSVVCTSSVKGNRM